MGKANISFPDGMLEDIDARASAGDMTRSAFVQEAVATYTARLDHDVERRAREQRIEQAITGMREIGESMAAGPDGATLIRRMRDEAPMWLSDEPQGDDE